MVDILREIIRMSGPEYLEQGICFVNAFADLGGTEKDIQLLRYLVETGGHTALLNAGELPAAQQRLRYSHTVSRLCKSRLISEELANDVCGSFWRAVYNTEPPAACEKREEPAPAPTPEPDEIYTQACECDRNGNTAEAVRLFRQAAELGHAEAQCRLGYRLMKGIGTVRDDAQAVDWFRKSAAQENPMGQYNLGYCLIEGIGTPKDTAQAVDWFRKSGAQGNDLAQNWLGVCYDCGQGVPRSDFEAVKWFQLAAEQGNLHAQYNLSLKYEGGEGVPRNLEQAVAWCRKSAAQGYEDAKKRLPALEAKLAAERKGNSSRSGQDSPAPSLESAKRKPDHSPSPPKRSISERLLLTLGWGCLFPAVVHLAKSAIVLCQDASGVPGWILCTMLWLFEFMLLFVPIACSQFWLWKRRPVIVFNSETLSNLLLNIQIYGSFLTILFTAIGVIADLADGLYSSWWIAIFPIYHVWWWIWLPKSNKASCESKPA